jgi:hypothetical protein
VTRNYAKEYADYHSRPAQKKNRASRNAARRSMIAAGRVRKGDGKDVDHRDGNPRDNRAGNLSVMSRSANRAKK